MDQTTCGTHVTYPKVASRRKMQPSKKNIGKAAKSVTMRVITFKTINKFTYLRGLYGDSSCSCLKHMFKLTSKAGHIS